MTEVLTVDLAGRVEGGASVEFLRAEMNGSMETPFALVRYSLNGVEQKNGLRIDLDKRAIFDRVGDPDADAVIERATPCIADLVGEVAAGRDARLRSRGALNPVP